MPRRWTEEFVRYAEQRGVPCQRLRHSNGWLETALIAGCSCFTKSVSYSASKHLYFLGIDPSKTSDNGDAVVICGGRNDSLADIFIIPWHQFFTTLSMSEPINTYHDREYYQYKSHIRDREGRWTCSFQGGSQPVIELTAMRFNPTDAVAQLQGMNCRKL
jgi:hypothetical protein